MNISQTTLRIGAVLGTIGAIVVLAASAQAATSKPAGMSQPEYRALMIRSEALNKLYGNAVTRLSPQQFKKLYQAGGNRMAPQELVALVQQEWHTDAVIALMGPALHTVKDHVDARNIVRPDVALLSVEHQPIGIATVLPHIVSRLQQQPA